ncbi:hypothetical protein [Streptomyces piniterrae]|nr:hypothetical protein [Streptomyces piniterrae]
MPLSFSVEKAETNGSGAVQPGNVTVEVTDDACKLGRVGEGARVASSP